MNKKHKIKVKELLEIQNKLAEFEDKLKTQNQNKSNVCLSDRIRRKFEVIINGETVGVYTSVRRCSFDLGISITTIRRRLNNITQNGLYNFDARYIES